MTNEQWEKLLAVVVRGERLDKPFCGFIADSPWLPGWSGKASILDYFASEQVWLETNLAAVRTFPEAVFLPGFWSEYGMCTEPSAFGAQLIWHENELPFAAALSGAGTGERALKLSKPDVTSAGLLPFTLQRLVRARPAIEAEGHTIRFAVARGPLNIASFLMGTTELLIAMQLDPDGTQEMLEVITAFLAEWIKLQAATIPSIRGVLLLDDIIGFIGPEDVATYAMPSLKRVFGAIDADIRFLHNDANGLSCAEQLADVGVNLFNFSFEHPIDEMRKLVGPEVGLLGNIPPRDVLAAGTPEQVRRCVAEQKQTLDGDFTRVIFSCGGGLPPGVSTANLRAFLEEAGK
ncbi:MAG TPA: uroporphyrinogen decarboxylase family protein [Kiritimatiellia bacterium]|nr:uroporphyrinogen decarboxylase family protein [Kiritimatiellia bacterium]HRU71175.1 uroporphyrinogen decarboxylase family protein [Kiritimatiellia bacterium]